MQIKHLIAYLVKECDPHADVDDELLHDALVAFDAEPQRYEDY